MQRQETLTLSFLILSFHTRRLLVQRQDARGQWPAYWDPDTDTPVK